MIREEIDDMLTDITYDLEDVDKRIRRVFRKVNFLYTDIIKAICKSQIDRMDKTLIEEEVIDIISEVLSLRDKVSCVRYTFGELDKNVRKFMRGDKE